MNFNQFFLTEDPDDIYAARSGNPIVFTLLADHWVYAHGYATHLETFVSLYNALDQKDERLLPGIFPKPDPQWIATIKKLLPFHLPITDFVQVLRGPPAEREPTTGSVPMGSLVRNTVQLSGRLDTQGFFIKHECSFWNTTDTVRKYLPQLEQFFNHLNLDIKSYLFEPMDCPWENGEMVLFTFKQLKSDEEFEAGRSKEQMRALMLKQHLDPDAKKALVGTRDVDVGSGKAQQRAHRLGYPSVAQYKFQTTQESFKQFCEPKTLYIMRGVSGSGKSTLAKQIQEREGGVIYSTDEFRYINGEYVFREKDTVKFHMRNMARAREAMERGITPIIIDNVNYSFQHAKPYVDDAYKYGYRVEVVEPSTPWAFDIEELTKKNSGRAPREVIQKMLDLWEPHDKFVRSVKYRALLRRRGET